MGYHTTLHFKAALSGDLPENVVALFKKAIVERECVESYPHGIDHDFFQTERWDVLLEGWFSDGGETIKSKFERNGKYWNIEINCAIKDYGDEIEKFLLWIVPWIIGKKRRQHVGFVKYEHERSPYQIHLVREYKFQQWYVNYKDQPVFTYFTLRNSKKQFMITHEMLK